MEKRNATSLHATDPEVGRHFTLRDSALVATIPVLYLGAFALRFWHILP
jgi:hypothetical protein